MHTETIDRILITPDKKGWAVYINGKKITSNDKGLYKLIRGEKE